MQTTAILEALGIAESYSSIGDLHVRTPIDGTEIGCLPSDDAESLNEKLVQARLAFESWRLIPAPRRGELIRLFGDELRRNKQHLGALVTLESGKILQEGLGEVQ